MSGSSSTSSSERRGLGPALLVAAALLLGDRLLALPPVLEGPAGPRLPYRALELDVDARHIAGVSPRARQLTNAQGLRGRVFGERTTNVLVVGGSTMTTTLLDEPEAIGPRLAERLRGDGVRVAVAARAGHPIAFLLPELEQIFARSDMKPAVVVAMFGANEVEFFFNHAPWIVEDPGGPVIVGFDPEGPYGPTRWSHTYAGWYQPGNGGRFIERPRVAYRAERKQDTLHPGHRALLAAALRDYADRLAALHALTQSVGAELVLVTQPLAETQEHPAPGRDWAPFFYAQPGEGFLPAPALMADLLDAFNRVTRSFAEARDLTLVELADALRDCGECFYDQWHFTLDGARRAAEVLAEPCQRAVDRR